MKLYLIRHGETVDNVAGLYAGTLDSKLTNHGVEQTKRLGAFFARNNVWFTHIFSSPLSRARKTAEAVRDAQESLSKIDKDGDEEILDVVIAPELIERDFGYYEGKPFTMRGREGQLEKDRQQPGFKDVETKEAMAKRIDKFLNERLLPLLEKGDGDGTVAVVAHGMLLSHLWRRLLLRFPDESLAFAPEVAIKKQGSVLEYIGGWSNTGYMELLFERKDQPSSEDKSEVSTPAVQDNTSAADAATLLTPVPPSVDLEEAALPSSTQQAEPSTVRGEAERKLTGWSTTVLAVDSTAHLLGLKRQRGGIGSLAHDEGQRKLESFFKRPRLT